MNYLIKAKLSDYLIVGYVLAISNFPFFTGDFHLILCLFIILFSNIVRYKNLKTSKLFLGFISLFLLIFFLQFLFKPNFAFGPVFAFFIRIFIAFYAIRYVGAEFFKIFVNVLSGLSIVGLFIYALLVFSPSIAHLLRSFSASYLSQFNPIGDQVNPNIILYTIEDSIFNTPPRNSGPFWEPGAYAIYLAIGIIFNTINSKVFINKVNLIFIIAIITTFSLAGYFSLLVIIISYLLYKKRFIYLYILIPAFLFLGYFTFNEFEFLSGKFFYRYQKYEARQGKTNYDKWDRLSREESTEVDLYLFMKNPFIGTGLNLQGNVRNTNTLSSFLRDYGGIAFILFNYFLFLSIRYHTRKNSWNDFFAFLMFGCLLISVLSQGLTNKPFYLAIVMMHLLIGNKKLYTGAK